MSNLIELSTLRILNIQGQTIGTGFLVSKNLVATCAHVVASIGMNAENCIQVQFTGEKEHLRARVMDEFLDYEHDVSILEIEAAPKGVNPFRLSQAAECRPGNEFRSFGYATAAEVQGIHANGRIDGYLNEHKLLQLQSAQANHGISGAPVLDEKRGMVVGMITKGHTELGRNELTTFATPSEILWQVCPQLKPYIPPLPRRNPIVEGINLLPYDYDQRIQNFLIEYLGTEAHPVPFGGRNNALNMLDTWLMETTPYLLLAAPAGRGKSALLVRWLDSLKARDDLSLAFVPVSIRFGINMERIFYAALAARLAYLHGDDIPSSPETSTAVYRGLVSDYLSKSLANGRTLLVVLDGLDEAADWQAGADFMPGELPAGVRVVISARFLAGDADSTPWLRRLNLDHNGLASAPSLPPLDQEGVRDVLFKMGCPLDELSRKMDIVAELYRLSAGDPLLVGLYVGDLWAKGELVTSFKPEDLVGIQPGYKGYFDRWWKDQKKLWSKDKPWLEKHVRAVRNLLAGSIGTLFTDDFQALDPELESDYIADALEVLQRFIIGDNQKQGYTFSHPKLGQYFWEGLTSSEQMLVEGRFLAWGEQTLQEFTASKRDPKKKADVPVYVVCNYGAHLARANQPIEKWLPLIYHHQWAQAWFTVEGAHGGYSHDVQRVWERFRLLDKQSVEKNGKALHIGKQIRCGLIESSLHSMAGNIPYELIPIFARGFWTLPQTWIFIRQMPEGYWQFKAIATLLPQVDDKSLLEVLDIARAIRDKSTRARVLSALAERLPDVAKEALKTAQAIRYEEERARVFCDLAQYLPEEMLGQILGMVQSEEVLIQIAQRLPEEELGKILEVTRATRDIDFRAHVLSALVQRLPEVAGEALDAVREIKNTKDRAFALIPLVEHLPNVADEALDAVREVSGGLRASAWRNLAEYLPEKYFDQVLDAVGAMKYSDNRSWVLNALAKRMPEEKLGQVLIAARAIQDNDEDRAEALSGLVQRLPEVAGEALDAARATPSEWPRAHLLSILAECLPDNKLGQILEAARVIRDPDSRALVLSTLAQRLPGVTAEALDAAREIKGDWAHAHVLSKLAQYLPTGELGQVLSIAQAIKDVGAHAEMLSVLVQWLPEVAGETLNTAKAVEESNRIKILSELVQCLPEENLEQVLEAAREIQNDRNRAHLLCELAQRLPEVAEEALETIRATWDDREEMLIQMTQYLPEEMLGQILEMARAMPTKRSQAEVLSLLARRLPKAAGEALAAAQAIHDQGDRTRELRNLAQHLPESALGQLLDAVRLAQDKYERAWVLSVLAQRLPELAREALDLVRTIPGEWARARMLSELAQCLPELAGETLIVAGTVDEKSRKEALNELAKHLSAGVLDNVLTAAQTINDESCRAEVLSTLAQRIPENMLGQVLDIARTMRFGNNRAEVLSALAQRLPEVTYEALDAIQTIQKEDDRMDIFNKLVKNLPERALGQALEVAQAVQNDRNRADMLKALVQSLINLPGNQYYPAMESSLGNLSIRNRAALLSDISALLPAFVHLGSEDTPCEIYAAVRDLTTWWP